MVISCLIYLLRKEAWQEIIELAKNKNLITLFGYLSLILGLFSIIFHNLWVGDWRLVITLFGWIALIKGIIGIGFPELTQKWIEKLEGKVMAMRVLVIFGILLGAWLIWVSCYGI
jgi:cation transport ATPase